jgi:tetratricopeptide (TPR) repeat protein
MLGLCLIAADCILSCLALARAEAKRQWVFAGLASVLLITGVFWSFVTARKAELWRTPLLMWGDMVSQFPNHKNVEGLAASQALLLLGVAQVNQGDHFAAAQSFLRATDANPNYAEAHYNLGKALLNLGRIEASLVYFRKSLKLKPNYWQAHNNLGIALARSGKVSEAIPHFEKALAINPGDIPTKNNLQIALKELRAKGNSAE